MAEQLHAVSSATCTGCPAVPEEQSVRLHLRQAAALWVTQRGLVPPLALPELRRHAAALLVQEGLATRFQDFATVLLGNAIWQETLATVPFERRVLLLPQCMRNRDRCPAEIDELGLLCEQCGGCVTGALQEQAEALGYVVLVAEGTTVVTSLLESGRIDAVIGISCLSALERSFPYTVAAGIPGLAIPLLADGCNQTEVDMTWVGELLTLRSAQPWHGRLHLEQLKAEVRSWFEPAPLAELLELAGTRSERHACEWIAAGGKRWRPFLASCVYQTLLGESAAQSAGSETMRRLAVAVECFHKASLAHDDIEDGDAFRYGQASLHSRHGVPIALNTGDLLVGEGYRLIAESGAPAERQALMLGMAARGHRELCLGQGEELAWTSSPGPITVDQVVEIFRRKTAPAFAVALVLGAAAAGADGELCAVLGRYSDALGVAYQIRDDIEDSCSDPAAGPDNDIAAMRPSLLLALARDQADAAQQRQIDGALQQGYWPDNGALIRSIVQQHGLEERAWQLFEQYRVAALEALQPLCHQPLKSLLFRIVLKVLGEPRGNGPAVDQDAVLSTAAAEVVQAAAGKGSISGHGW